MEKVGLIQGRHEMPVKEYLLAGEVPFATAHIAARDAAMAWSEQKGISQRHNGELAERAMSTCLREDPIVNLYITGLTRAVLGALAGFRDAGVSVCIWEYNTATEQYESVVGLSYASVRVTEPLYVHVGFQCYEPLTEEE